MNLLHRLRHYATSNHTWRLAVDTGSGGPATAHLTCVPCGITRPIPDHQYLAAPCFCQRSTCYGWQAFVAAFIALHRVTPTRLDVETDARAHDELIPLSDRLRTSSGAAAGTRGAR